MKILEQSDQSVSLQLSRSDLALLANALNETGEALEDWELPIRVGANRTEIERLHLEIKAMLNSMSHGEPKA